MMPPQAYAAMTAKAPKGPVNAPPRGLAFLISQMRNTLKAKGDAGYIHTICDAPCRALCH